MSSDALSILAIGTGDLSRGGSFQCEQAPTVSAGLEKLAHHHFDLGLRVTHFIPRRAAACVLTMAGIYQAILEEIESDPYLPLCRRVSLSGKEKLAVATRSWMRAV